LSKCAIANVHNALLNENARIRKERERNDDNIEEIYARKFITCHIYSYFYVCARLEMNVRAIAKIFQLKKMAEYFDKWQSFIMSMMLMEFLIIFIIFFSP
jgi:hypothetical protein